LGLELKESQKSLKSKDHLKLDKPNSMSDAILDFKNESLSENSNLSLSNSLQNIEENNKLEISKLKGQKISEDRGFGINIENENHESRIEIHSNNNID